LPGNIGWVLLFSTPEPGQKWREDVCHEFHVSSDKILYSHCFSAGTQGKIWIWILTELILILNHPNTQMCLAKDNAEVTAAENQKIQLSEAYRTRATNFCDAAQASDAAKSKQTPYGHW